MTRSQIARATAMPVRFKGGPQLIVFTLAALVAISRTASADPLFAPPVTFGTGQYPRAVAVSDLNGDGKLDIVTGGDASTISVLLGNGNGTYGARTDFSTGGSGAVSMAVGDLNGDGKLDVVIGNANYTVSVLLGNGNGTFGAGSNYGTGGPAKSVAVGDLSGDGKLDLATASYYSSTISVLLGNGNGTFGANSLFSTGKPNFMAISDLNRDGKRDCLGEHCVARSD